MMGRELLQRPSQGMIESPMLLQRPTEWRAHRARGRRRKSGFARRHVRRGRSQSPNTRRKSGRAQRHLRQARNIGVLTSLKKRGRGSNMRILITTRSTTSSARPCRRRRLAPSGKIACAPLCTSRMSMTIERCHTVGSFAMGREAWLLQPPTRSFAIGREAWLVQPPTRGLRAAA